LLKNELSLHFLRDIDNLSATVRSQLRIFAGTNKIRKEEEKRQLKLLNDLVKRAKDSYDDDEEKPMSKSLAASPNASF
jgi:hypothetical protein